jgi:hypothetical protein
MRIKIMKQLFDSFKSTSLDVLPNLKERYGLLLRHDLVSVKLMQKDGQILLEFTVTDKDHYSFDNKIIVKSLSLNSAADSLFSSTVSIFDNGRLLVEELPPTTLARLADLFDESSAAAIINYAQQG